LRLRRLQARPQIECLRTGGLLSGPRGIAIGLKCGDGFLESGDFWASVCVFFDDG
jgi:hypothetical protein